MHGLKLKLFKIKLLGNFNHHWVWWIASLLGSLQCAAVYKLFFAEEEKLFGFVRQATKKTYTEIPTNNDAWKTILK